MEFLLFVAVVGVWIYAIVIENRRQESLRALQEKVDALERRIEWNRTHPGPANAASAVKPAEAPAPAAATPTDKPPVAPYPLVSPGTPAPPPPPAPKPLVTPPIAQPPAPPIMPKPVAPSAPITASVRPPASATPLVRPAAPVTPLKPAVPKKKFSEAFEEMVGTNWLPKLGVVILFVGLASWIASQWGRIPLIARVVMFFVLGGGMLFGGIAFEKRGKQYLVLGRALIGVGWSTLFLTTFAMHHVQAVKVIDSLILDLALVMAVVAAMVLHTLRYESQLVTGLCFGLGFFTIAQSHASVWSLLAGVFLASGLVIIVLKREWFELEVFGILASFLNHGYWLFPIIEGMRVQFGHNVPFPGYVPSLSVLAFYWAIFRASYVIRGVDERSQEAVSTVAAILNTILLLGIAYYQSLHQKELAFSALLALGLIETALALLPRIRVARPIAFRVLSTIGWCLIVASVPVRFGGDTRVILWLVTAQAFFFSGVFSRERLFQRFGAATAILIGIHQIVSQGIPYLMDVFSGVRSIDRHAAIVLGISAAAYYLDAHVCRVLWPDRFDDDTDHAFLQCLSYVAGAVLLLTVYLIVPPVWASTAVAVVMLALALAGNRLHHGELLHEAHLFAAVAFSDVLVMNAQRNNWERVVTFLTVAAALYIGSRIVRVAKERTEFDRLVAATYTWFGTALVALLIYFRFPDSRMAILWALFGLALAIEARIYKLRHFWMQAHVLALAAIVRVLLFNLHDANIYRFGISGRLISVPVVAALLYAIAKAAHIEEFTTKKMRPADALLISQSYTWGGTGLLSLLIFYATNDWRTALMWSAFALCLGALGTYLKRRELNWQATVLAGFSFVAALIVNMDATMLWRGLTVRLLSVAAIAAAFYALNLYAPRERLRPLFTWGGSLLVTWLLWYELLPINVALAWGVVGVLLLEIGLTKISDDWQLKNLRFQSYAAFIAAFARLFFVNFNAPRGSELLISVSPLPFLFFYGFWRTMDRDELRARGISANTLLAYVATASVVSILRFTVEPDWVVLGWAALFAALLFVARASRELVFRDQALILTVPIAFRGLMHNVYQVHIGTAPNEPRNALLIACAVMVAALPFAFKMRDRESALAAASWKFLLYRPEQVAFFVPLALTLVLFTQLFPGVLMTLSWGVLAVAVFAAALAIGERSFRLAGLTLLLICVAKIILLDVWNFNDTNARYMTLILMGAILLTVSFLYARFRDKVRELL